MRGGDRREAAEPGHALEDAARCARGARGPRDTRPSVEAAGLVEDPVGDARACRRRAAARRGAGARRSLGVGAHARREADGDHGDARSEWPAVYRRLGVDDRRERVGDAVQAVVVGAHEHGRRAPARRRVAPALGAHVAQKRGVVGRGAERVDERAGRTSRRARARSARPRGAGAPRAGEDLDRLREAEDAREQRDLLAARGRGAGRCRPSARRARGSPRPSPRTVRACARSRRRGRSAAERARRRRARADRATRAHARARATARRRPGARCARRARRRRAELRSTSVRSRLT